MIDKELEQMTDEELIDCLRDGESKVADYLCEKYKNLVRKEANSMFILGADHEDLIQEGMIGLFKAMNHFDAGRDASFYTFAKLCISRQLYTAIQASNRQKNIPLNNYISISGGAQEVEGETEDLNKMVCLMGQNPEESLIDKENVRALERQIEEELSDFEKKVLDLRLTGMGTKEISKVLGREQKATENALNRLKTKIRKIMSKEDA